MRIEGFSLHSLPREIKYFLSAFLLVLSVGYFTGISFVSHTDSITPKGIAENYLGNEDQADARVLKFEKSPREMLTIIHTHVLSVGFIFMFLGVLVWLTRLPILWKAVLTIEPFISILCTFGGLVGVWMGSVVWTYIVMVSGILMTLAYVLGVAAVLYELWGPN